MSDHEMTFEEAFGLALDHYEMENIDYCPNMDTTAADLERALARWNVTVIGDRWPL
ncbi:hypothetical protein ACFCV3_42050 [Kribbella sp. NPDC056345]|uniref:hypothetical protein n=1 Tax=Kribbella sp. NPDC056345 TaxID=3345789 RepID=UPI0035D9420A